jgi:diaminopimelate decarboxylase
VTYRSSIRNRALPSDLPEGDNLEFSSLGAYGSTTATTRLNGYGARKLVEVA